MKGSTKSVRSSKRHRSTLRTKSKKQNPKKSRSRSRSNPKTRKQKKNSKHDKEKQNPSKESKTSVPPKNVHFGEGRQSSSEETSEKSQISPKKGKKEREHNLNLPSGSSSEQGVSSSGDLLQKEKNPEEKSAKKKKKGTKRKDGGESDANKSDNELSPSSSSYGSDERLNHLNARNVQSLQRLLADSARGVDEKLERYAPITNYSGSPTPSALCISPSSKDWPCRKERSRGLERRSTSQVPSLVPLPETRRTTRKQPSSDSDDSEEPPKRCALVRSRRGNAAGDNSRDMHRVRSSRSIVKRPVNEGEEILPRPEKDHKTVEKFQLHPHLHELLEDGEHREPDSQVMSAHSRRCLARRMFLMKQRELAAKGLLPSGSMPSKSKESLPWTHYLSASLLEELPATHINEPEYDFPSLEPHRMTVEELLQYAYHIIKWTPEELVYRERNICYCLQTLDIDNLQEMKFSKALEMYLKTSPLGIFLEHFNEGGDFGNDSNIYRYDMLEMDERAEKLLNQDLRNAEEEGEGYPSSEVTSSPSVPSLSASKSTKSRQNIRRKSRSKSKFKKRSKSSTGSKTPKTSKGSTPSSKLSKTPSKTSSKLKSPKEKRKRSKGKKSAIDKNDEKDEKDEDDKKNKDSKENEKDENDVFHTELMNIIKQAVLGNERFINPIILPRIRRLRLVACDMTTVDKGTRRVKGLVILSLALNWIKVIQGSVLPRRLVFLELFCNLISDLSPLAENMPACLMYLGLARNKLTDQSNLGLLASETSGNLRSLDLGDNDICSLEETLKALAGLPQLLALRLHGNPCSTVAAYRELTLHTLPQLLVLDDAMLWPVDKPKRIKKEDEELFEDGARHGALVASLIRLLGVPKPEKESIEKRQVQHLYLVEMELPLLDPHFRKPIPPPQDSVSSKTPSAHASSSQMAMKSLASPEPPPPTPASHVTLPNADHPHNATRSRDGSTMWTSGDDKRNSQNLGGSLKPVASYSPFVSKTNSSLLKNDDKIGNTKRKNDKEERRQQNNKEKEGSSKKKGHRKKALQSKEGRSSRDSTRSGKGGRGSRKSRRSQDKFSEFQTENDKSEDSITRSSQLMNTEDVVAEMLTWGRHPLQPSAYESSPCEWNKVMEAEEPLVVVAPEDDLLALRDTFRTFAAVRVVHSRVLLPRAKKVGKKRKKSKKSKRKSSKGKGKKENESPKKKSKNSKGSIKRSKSSSQRGSSKSDSTSKSRKSKAKKKSESSSPDRSSRSSIPSEEPHELSRELLGSFWVPLHQPAWYEKPVEYTWSIDDYEDVAQRSTEPLKDLFPKDSPDKKGKKGKKNKKKKKSKGKKKKKKKDKKKEKKKGKKKGSTRATSPSTASTSSTRKSKSKPKKFELPENLTVHLAFGLHHLNDPEYQVPLEDHINWQGRKLSARKKALKRKLRNITSKRDTSKTSGSDTSAPSIASSSRSNSPRPSSPSSPPTAKKQERTPPRKSKLSTSKIDETSPTESTKSEIRSGQGEKVSTPTKSPKRPQESDSPTTKSPPSPKTPDSPSEAAKTSPVDRAEEPPPATRDEEDERASARAMVLELLGL